MTRRERLRLLYNHLEVDRPGVFNRTGYPENDPTYDEVKAYLAEKSELKGWWPAHRLLEPLPAEWHTEPFSEDFERRVCVLHTPKGDLRSTFLASRKGQPGMMQEYLLKTPEDIEAYLSLPLPKVGGEVDAFFEADRAMGDRGIVEVGFGINPAGEAVELLGSDAFARMSVTNREALHALCERRLKVQMALLQYCLERGLGPYFAFAGQEYFVPPLHGPRDFWDFSVRYDRPLFDEIHNAGGRVHVHCHGRVQKVMEAFVYMGVDVLHPFEAPPMGDITAAEAKEAARGRMTLEGNIQIADMYERSPDEIRDQVRALIRDVFDDQHGLIVAPTASGYIRGAGARFLERCRAMVGAVLECEA